MTKSERLAELDILRAFAILGVIFIHILGASFQFQVKWSWTWNIYVVLDQFLRFAVPAFVFLSGFTLALKYRFETFRFREFYTRRIIRILPWYFFWSAVIFAYMRYVRVENWEQFPLWKIIFLGKADYHLYFVSMIFQLYLLFPLILYLLFKFNRKFVVFIFLFQATLYFASSLYAGGAFKLNFLWGDQQQYLFFGTWIFYFVLGIIFAQKQYRDEQIAKLKKFSIYFAVFGLFLSIYDCFHIARTTGDLIIAARSSRVFVLFYATGWLVCVFVWGKSLLMLPGQFKKGLIYLGHKSYLIYLLHTLVIRIVAIYFVPSSFLNLVFFTFLILTFSVLLAEVSDRCGKFMYVRVFKR